MYPNYPYYRLSNSTPKVVHQKGHNNFKIISHQEAILFAKLRFSEWVKYLTQVKTFKNYSGEAKEKIDNKLLAKQCFEQNIINLVKQRCKGCNIKLSDEEGKLMPYCSDCIADNSVKY